MITSNLQHRLSELRSDNASNEINACTFGEHEHCLSLLTHQDRRPVSLVVKKNIPFFHRHLNLSHSVILRARSHILALSPKRVRITIAKYRQAIPNHQNSFCSRYTYEERYAQTNR